MKQILSRLRDLCLLFLLLVSAVCNAGGYSSCIGGLVPTQTFREKASLFGELTMSTSFVQWIFPQMTFSCPTVIRSIQLGVRDTGSGIGKDQLPVIQIWRPTTNTRTEYYRVHEISGNMVPLPGTNTILSYSHPPLSVASGDILGFYQPDSFRSRYILSLQVYGGFSAFSKRDNFASQDRFNIQDGVVENDMQIYPLVSVSTDDGCALGFLGTSSLWNKVALENDEMSLSNKVIAHDYQLRVIPGIQFSCSGILTMVTFAAQERDIISLPAMYPELQVWRNPFDDFYSRQQSISLSDYYSGGHLNIFNVSFLQPVSVTNGDILGLYLPPTNRCPLSVKFLPSTFYRAESYSRVQSTSVSAFYVNSDTLHDFDPPLLDFEFFSTCEMPPPLINGRISSPENRKGSVAIYTCNEGYILEGPRERTCQSNQWSEVPPTCALVDCGRLEPPRHGFVRYEETTFQAVATYECEYGFSLDGDEQRVCTGQGVWSGTDTLCEGIKCTRLSLPENGLSLIIEPVIMDSQIEATAHYSCDVNHTLYGSNTRTCLESQMWTGEAPLCVADCPSPPHLPNRLLIGTGNNSRNTLFSVATYICSKGSRVPGHTEFLNITLICGENSQWVEASNLADCEVIPSSSTSDSLTTTTIITSTANISTEAPVSQDITSHTPVVTSVSQNYTASLPTEIVLMKATSENLGIEYLALIVLIPILAVIVASNIIIITCLCKRRRKRVAKKRVITGTLSNSVNNPVYGVGNPFSVWNSNFDNTYGLHVNTNAQDRIEDDTFYEQPLEPQQSRNMSPQVRSSRESQSEPNSRKYSLHYEVSSIVNLAKLSSSYDEHKWKRESQVAHNYDNASNYALYQYDTPPSPYEIPTPRALHDRGSLPNIYGSIPWSMERTSVSSSTHSPLLQFKKSNGSVFFEDCDVYWKPASDSASLYDQLVKNRYREILRKKIEITDNLGSGQFGQVDKGLWQSATGVVEVAVKTLRPGATEIDKVKFLQEAAITGQFQHPNVVRLHGVVTNGEPVMIVLEILSNRDLRAYLIKSRPTPGECLPSDTPKQLLKFCADIASGMTYLAKKAFVHRDLAARNIFLTMSKTCKIGDFGMSRDLEDESYYISHGGQIPVKWTSPEALHYKKYSTASDVWSFGCVMYEIWSLGHKPFETLSNFETIRHIDDGYRLPPPPGCMREIYSLMIHCWHPKSSKRPSFIDLHHILSTVSQDILSGSGNDLKASVLGGPLLSSDKLYPDLQGLYNTQPLSN